MNRAQMEIGGRYNWKNQPERLIYLGRNWSGNGYWNQFALTDEPKEVWCEVLDEDLCSFEVTKAKENPAAVVRPPNLSARQAKKIRKTEKRAAAQKGQTNDQ